MSRQLDLFERFGAECAVHEPALEIPGLTYVADFLSPTEHREVLLSVDQLPWRDDLKRRVQHYGYRYDYKARRVDRSMYLGHLPTFAVPIAARLAEAGIVESVPDQLIVNEYLPGQGISAHIDCEPCFGEHIVMVSLGWAYEMQFIQSATRECRSVLLATGSAVAIAGEARHKWLHQIKAVKSDRGIRRQRRVSLTFRNVVLDEDAKCPR